VSLDPNVSHHFRPREGAEVADIVQQGTKHSLVVMALGFGKVRSLKGMLRGRRGRRG